MKVPEDNGSVSVSACRFSVFVVKMGSDMYLYCILLGFKQYLDNCKCLGRSRVGRQANHTLCDSGLGQTDFKKSWASKCHFSLDDAYCLMWQSVLTNGLHNCPKIGVKKVDGQKKTIYCTGKLRLVLQNQSYHRRLESSRLYQIQ